jgi:hypothetical protein
MPSRGAGYRELAASDNQAEPDGNPTKSHHSATPDEWLPLNATQILAVARDDAGCSQADASGCRDCERDPAERARRRTAEAEGPTPGPRRRGGRRRRGRRRRRAQRSCYHRGRRFCLGGLGRRGFRLGLARGRRRRLGPRLGSRCHFVHVGDVGRDRVDGCCFARARGLWGGRLGPSRSCSLDGSGVLLFNGHVARRRLGRSQARQGPEGDEPDRSPMEQRNHGPCCQVWDRRSTCPYIDRAEKNRRYRGNRLFGAGVAHRTRSERASLRVVFVTQSARCQLAPGSHRASIRRARRQPRDRCLGCGPSQSSALGRTAGGSHRSLPSSW